MTAHLWQSTLFALLAGLLTLAFRKNRAKVRYWLWLSASFKFFVPFSLLMSLGSHLEWAPVARKIAAPDVSFAMERIVTQPFPEPFSVAPSAPGALDWKLVAILCVWMCGLAVIALLRLELWLRIRACMRASKPLNIPSAVEIRSSPGLLEPGVVGLLRPVLLLPEGITERLTPSELDAVLAHELCHVRRCDNLLASIHMIVEAIFWFHPAVWWIGAKLVEEREQACDEAVLSLGSEPRVYAAAILSVCKLYMESPLVCVSGVTGSNLKRRIEAIMTNRIGQRLNRAKKLLLASAALAALAGPVAIGVVIGAGNPPVIRAQSSSSVLLPASPPQTAPVAPAATAQARTAPPPENPFQDRRLVAMLFDFGAMTSEEQARVRQSAIDFIHTRMLPADVVAVMMVSSGGVSVTQDFTDDQAVLEAAILKLNAAVGNGSAPNDGARLSNIETAVKLLAAIPGNKALIYFSNGAAQPDSPSELRKAIEMAQNAGVALYPMDARGTAPQAAVAGTPQDEHSRRVAEAQARFGSASSAMARIFIRYGPPDQTESRGSNSQIWHYNYLETFHNSAEFEFTPGNSSGAVSIKWPPPLATYEGVSGVAAALAGALMRERQGPGAPAANSLAGLPGRHASFKTYPSAEPQMLSVPLDALSGAVDILAQIQSLPNAGGIVANLRSSVQASSGVFQTGFTLRPGAYTCSLIVREQATGTTFGETISFEVK